MSGKLQKFTHPGTLIDPKRLPQFSKVSVHPKAILQLQRRVSSSYEPRALPVVSIGAYGTGQGHKEICGDGEMCYYYTIAYLYFGDVKHAETASKILERWSTVNTKFEGSNAPLEASWGVGAMIRCAELLRYTYTNWKASGVQDKFEKWISSIVYPLLCQRITWTNNWSLTMAEARMQLAIYRNDKDEFERMVSEYKRVFNIYVIPYKTGQCLETKRDIVHSCFGIGSMINICEMAWHQGVDLYNAELMACIEYHARIINGEVPSDLQANEIKENRFQCIGWEIGLQHFKTIKKWSMPHTEKLLTQYRPEKACFCWGLSTMTHFKP